MKRLFKKVMQNEKLLRVIEIAQSNWQRAEVMQYAGTMAYFFLLSLVPILLSVANIIPMLPLDPDAILNLLSNTLPADIQKIITPMLVDYLNSGSSGVLSIALLTTLWSASRVFSNLQKVLNGVYGTVASKNFIVARLLSFVVMAGLLLLLAAGMFTFVFGEYILRLLSDFIPIEVPLINSFLFWRWIILVVFLLLFFVVIYHFIPNHHLSIVRALPGAIFSTVGWLLLAEFFSLYTSMAGNEMLANATIGGFIILMLFIYFLNVVLLMGAMLNAMIFEWREGESVTTYEENIQKEKRRKEEHWGGYPEPGSVTMLHSPLRKFNQK